MKKMKIKQNSVDFQNYIFLMPKSDVRKKSLNKFSLAADLLKRVLFPNCFNVFHQYEPFCFMLESNFYFNLYALNTHDLKCNINPLTPVQIIFSLSDTENHKFKNLRTCLLI